MMSRFLKRQFRTFGGRYGYDPGYLCEIADLDAAGAAKLAMLSAITNHRFSLAAGPYFAAKIAAIHHHDCGSCLSLAIVMAREAGVGCAELDAFLAGEPDAPRDMVLAARYALALLDNDPRLPDIIAQAEARWGRTGLSGLAAATVSGAFYPLLKRGLGYAAACEAVMPRLNVSNQIRTEHHGG